jgi:hypothetical protein
MKILKYFIMAVLVVTVTRKIHPGSNQSLESSSQTFEYDAMSKTVLTQTNGTTQVYVGVIAVNPTVTPPTISAPALKFIAQIPALDDSESSFGYGSSSKRNLFGLPVFGQPTAVFQKKIDKNHKKNVQYEEIGLYWSPLKKDNTVNNIVQLKNGATYVCITMKAITKKYGAYAVGPVWTWYDSKELLPYGISTKQQNFKSLVEKIGIIINGNTEIELYGVKFNAATETESTTPASDKILQHQQSMHIQKETQIPGMDSFTETLKESRSYTSFKGG